MHFSFQLKTEIYSSAHECTYIKQYTSVVLLCITHMCLIMPLSFWLNFKRPSTQIFIKQFCISNLCEFRWAMVPLNATKILFVRQFISIIFEEV